MLSTNVRIETPSESCLPSCARAPEPSSSTTIAPAIGSQITTLSNGQFISSRPEHEPTDERREADDHRERVVVEVARLEIARDARDEPDGLRAAVHDRAVDQHLVADLPEEPAEKPPAPRKHVLVEPVEVVLVREHAIEARELLLPARRQIRPLEIQEPRGHERRQSEIDRRAFEAMGDELRGPVKALGGFAERVVLGPNEDRAVEP